MSKVKEYLERAKKELYSKYVSRNTDDIEVLLLAQMYQSEDQHKELIANLPYGLLNYILMELKTINIRSINEH